MSDVKDGSGDKEKKRKRTIKIESGSTSNAGDSKIDVKRIKAEPAKVQVDTTSGRSLFYAEEEEVESRDVNKDTDLFKSACEDIQKTIYEIRQLKDSKDKNVKAEIDSKRMEGMLQIVMLKKLNRLAHIRCKGVRDGTNEAKQRIDKCHLQLQNLLYEVMHMEKEITKCFAFRSKDEEIDLVPLDEFYKEAPDDISKPETTKGDLHLQTLARLDWELEQRKKLAGKLKDLEREKGSMASEISTQQDYLENLQPKLSTILQSTKPVQEYLGMPFDARREEHQTAQHLPHPLYVLYMQTSAYKDACDSKLTVHLEGDVNAAKAMDMTAPFLLEEDSDSDQEDQDEQDKKSSKRRRKTVEVRSKESKTKILTKHPLTVVMDVHNKDESVLHLTFSYLIYLKVITVKVKLTVTSAGPANLSGGDLLSPDHILSDLYPGDHGNTSPNHSNQYELARFGLGEFGTYIGQLGRPYLWAQWLGGVQFLQGEVSCRAPQTSVSVAHMQNTVKKIRRRIKSRLSLLKQLNSLEHKTIPVSRDYQSLFPVKTCSQLSSWQRSSRAEFEEAAYTQAVVEAGLAGETDMYFTAVFERASAKMTARIVLAPDYPSVAPLFCVNIHWQRNRHALNDSHVKEMEEEVNVHYEELVASERSRDQLLTNQLQRLAVCLDVYLETDAQGTDGPVEIPREKVFSRVAKGPLRSKPYKFCPDSGIFTHR